MKAERMTSKMRIEKWKQKSRSMVTSDRFGAPLSIQLFQFIAIFNNTASSALTFEKK